MKFKRNFSIFNFIFLFAVGAFLSYYGFFVGQSSISYQVAFCGAMLIGYSVQSTFVINTRFRD